MTWFNDVGLLHYHASLLSDKDRVDRFREAIHEVVRPGDVVVDVGTGTGLLAFFACQAGAARVFAIEEGPIVDVAHELAIANGFADRIEFFNDRSYRVQLPEQADVLISETLWNFGIGEGMVGFLADARRRFLKPGARSIPAAVDLHIAPVQTDGVYAVLHARPANRHGIDFATLRRRQVNNVQMPHLHSKNFLGEPALLVSTELDETAATDFEAEVGVTATRPGSMHGVCGWFACRLTPTIVLDNEPPSVASSWAHAFFPLQDPIGVLAGDAITMRITSSEEGSVWRWRTEVRRAGTTIRAYDQSTRDGFPDPPAPRPGDIAAGAGPQTTRDGEVVAWVLQAMDGTRSLAQLENEAVGRFGSRFREPDDARALVRDAVATLGR